MGWFSTPTNADHHNDGQRDASDGKPSTPPNSGLAGAAVRFVLGSSDTVREMNAEDRAYEKGYHNAEGQK